MKRQTCIRLLSCVLLSSLLMTVCSMASPLFPLHTGVDQNCFLTVGKAMLSGTVPYGICMSKRAPCCMVCMPWLHGWTAMAFSESIC